MELPSPHSHKWSFADQALVSGNNFLIGILLARTLGVDNFGSYVIATTYLLYANSLQSSLVVAPMMTAVPGLPAAADQHRLIRRFFTYFCAVAVVSVVLVVAASSLLGHWSEHLGVASLLAGLVVAMVAFQLQDWLRRVLYARSANRAVFFADLVAYGGQILGLLAEAVAGTLTAERALWIMAAAFTVSAVGCLASLRLVPDFAGGMDVMRQHWRASRDFLLSWQLQWLGSQGIILMGTGMIGPQAAGAIRAAQNLLGPVNVFFQWMDNVVPVQAARRLRERGPWGLWHLLSVIGVVGVVVIASMTAALWLFDDDLMAMLYGEAYRPFGFLIVLQAVFFLVGHVYRMFSYHSRAADRTARLASASLWWALAAFVCALVSVATLDEAGIMLALVVGEVVGVAYLVWQYRRDPLLPRTEAASHVVLRRGDGSVHLVLPAAGGSLLQGALSLYFPSRWTGRAYKRFLSRFLPWQNRLRWGEPTAELAGWRPYVEVVVPLVPGASADRVAALVSGSGAREKIVARLMDSDGRAIAYGRIGRDADAVDALERERRMLSYLAESSVSAQVPAMLGDGWIDCEDGRAYYLIQSAGGDIEAPRVLTPAHFAFLESMVAQDAMRWGDILVAAGRPYETGLPDGDAMVRRSLDWLSGAPIDTLRTCIQHGDFAPWNIRTRDNDSIFVFDWEHGATQGLPVVDALHFNFQQAVLVDRLSPAQAVERAIAGLGSAEGVRYLKRVGLAATHVPRMLALYLLENLRWRCLARAPIDTCLPRAYLGALAYLLEAHQ